MIGEGGVIKERQRNGKIHTNIECHGATDRSFNSIGYDWLLH
jgi:hypothetical protein